MMIEPVSINYMGLEFTTIKKAVDYLFDNKSNFKVYGERTLQRYAKNGKIDAIRVGKTTLVSLTSLEDFAKID